MDKKFITLTNDDGTESVYEIIDECTIEGNAYVSVSPAEYYVLKRVKSGKKEDVYVSVEGDELNRVFPIIDERINKKQS